MSKNPTNPLDLKIRDILALYDDSITSDMDESDIVQAFDQHPKEVVQEIFSEVHPANVGQLLYDLSDGLDDGFTAQGSYHTDFQRAVNAIQKDPDDLYD